MCFVFVLIKFSPQFQIFISIFIFLFFVFYFTLFNQWLFLFTISSLFCSFCVLWLLIFFNSVFLFNFSRGMCAINGNDGFSYNNFQFLNSGPKTKMWKKRERAINSEVSLVQFLPKFGQLKDIPNFKFSFQFLRWKH